MQNLDALEEVKKAILAKMTKAVKDDDETAFAEAFTQFADSVQQSIMQEARQLVDTHDTEVLARRGVRQLTSEETAFYNKVIDAMKSNAPQAALSNIDVVLPKTVIDEVFEGLEQAHPLLGLIDFQNTGPLVEFLLSSSSGVSAWGEIDAAITSELAASFSKVDLVFKKLSAFIPVAKAFLDLGPSWLDRYVRTLLTEALAVGLETAIVDGDGDDKPLGMTRQLTGALDNVFPRKAPVAVTKLDPVTIGGILDTISEDVNGKRRAVPNLLMVVNPADYYTKVYPATTIRTADGSYNRDVFPYPVSVVLSDAAPEGHAVFGLAPKYFMGLGTSKGGKLEYSDEYKFLEDQRTYLIKLYGNGRPKDANAFVYADISGLVPTNLQVDIVNWPSVPGEVEVTNWPETYPEA
jgi:HK97 family phage major capsid protein